MPRKFDHSTAQHVAGILALLFQEKPIRTAQELKEYGIENPRAVTSRRIIVAYLAVLGLVVRILDAGDRFHAVPIEPFPLSDGTIMTGGRVGLRPPFSDQIDAAAEHFHIMLTGPRGTGKTAAAVNAARKAGKELVVYGHADLMVEELRGTMTLKDGNSVFVPGPVTLAIINGAWLLFDELNLCRPGVSAWMKNLLDGTGVLAISETEQAVPVPNDFRAFFC